MRKIPELRIIGNPKLGNVTIASNDKKINMYDLGAILSSKGWFLGSGLGQPTLCCTIHEKNHANMHLLATELKAAIERVKKGDLAEDKGSFKIYGEIKGVPTFITERIVAECLEGVFDISALKSTIKKLDN